MRATCGTMIMFLGGLGACGGGGGGGTAPADSATDGASPGDVLIIDGAGGAAGHPNEPAGFTLIADRDFNALDEDGMVNFAGASNWSIVDASSYVPALTTNGVTITPPGVAPRGTSNIGQIQFPKDFPAGSGPINIGFSPTLGSRNITKMYVDFDFQMSSNWSGNQASTLKLLMPRNEVSGVTNRVIISPHGAFSNPLRTSLLTQGTIVPSTSQPPLGGTPQSAATVTRGTWTRWECLFTNNTPGNADGRVEIWQDGVKIIDQGGYEIVNSGTYHWADLSINPTFGGSGAAVPDQQFIWIDNLYVSGAP